MRKTLISILVTAALAVVAYVLTGAFVSDATPKPASNRVLTGDYHQTANGIPNTKMSAVITDGNIEVTLVLDSGAEGDSDVTGLYWTGSFDTSNTSDSFSVASKADTKALDASLFGSQADTKVFDYDRGDLNFTFTIRGMTTTVHLSK
jgi:hypothetical protein